MTMMVIAISDNLSPESSSFNPEDMDIESKWATNLLECLKLFYREHCVYLPAMAGWFIFSALLSSYNKLVFGAGHIAFPCPLLLTSIHFFIQWTFSWSISTLFPKALGGDRVQEMSWREYLSVSIPCGIVTSGDVGMSNLAIVRISITFYTMIKASTPVFVLAWAYMFGIEKITFPLILVVAIIASGEFLTVVGETEFDLAGFLLCLTASCLSGARWTLVQLKIKSLDPPLKTTVATMRVLSPSMFASMLLIALIVEKPWTLGGEGYFDDLAQVLHTLALGLLGAIFAIAMILCEFSLIMKASAIILMLGGVIKEMMTIIVG
jgi:solute carrier family 35 protein C2